MASLFFVSVCIASFILICVLSSGRMKLKMYVDFVNRTHPIFSYIISVLFHSIRAAHYSMLLRVDYCKMFCEDMSINEAIRYLDSKTQCQQLSTFYTDN